MHKVEWVNIDEGIAIRQGDLLIKRDIRDKTVQDRLITITADCDFAQTKTGGALAAFRVLTLNEYVSLYWSKRQAERLANDQKELFSTFNKLIYEAAARSPMSISAIESWISRTPGEQIVRQLEVQDQKLEKKLIAATSKLKALESVFLASDKVGCLEEIVNYYSLKDLCDNSVARETVMKRVRSDLGAMPDDIFFLNTLGEDFQVPHIVLLRNLVFLSIDDATVSAETARERGCYLRYGRLSPTFKYAISQQFALLYSRIGLPAEYDKSKKSHASNFTF